MRFNPPPTWPPPPAGWSPPPGWRPNPAWPPPPPGWPLWVPGVHRRHTGAIIGAAVALAVAIVASVVLLVVASDRPTEDEQIRAAVVNLEQTYNRSDFDAFRASLCTDIKNEISEKTWHTDNRWSLTIDSLVITGDRATARITNDFDGSGMSNTENLFFVRENGKWKACTND